MKNNLNEIKTQNVLSVSGSCVLLRFSFPSSIVLQLGQYLSSNVQN